MVVSILQFIGVFLLASTKFLYSPAAAYASDYSFIQTLLTTCLGGFFGVILFFKTGTIIMRWWNARFHPKKKEKKKFTKKNRAFITFRSKYGLYGLSLLTPCIISIPIGCLLAGKYYESEKLLYPLMFASVVFWSIVLTSITYLVGPIVI